MNNVDTEQARHDFADIAIHIDADEREELRALEKELIALGESHGYSENIDGDTGASAELHDALIAALEDARCRIANISMPAPSSDNRVEAGAQGQDTHRINALRALVSRIGTDLGRLEKQLQSSFGLAARARQPGEYMEEDANNGQ